MHQNVMGKIEKDESVWKTGSHLTMNICVFSFTRAADGNIHR